MILNAKEFMKLLKMINLITLEKHYIYDFNQKLDNIISLFYFKMILIGIWLYCATVISGREIDFVLALWRHGKRSPMVFIDEFGDNLNIWPNGKGQLTQEGVEIHQRMSKELHVIL